MLNVLAEGGYVDAQYTLGMIYLYEDYVEQNHPLGIKWLKKAAENGDVNAQVSLAKCYEEGRGVMMNIYDAMTWYMKASLQGNEEATERLNELEEY